ncbi:MAG TPA: GNAT family N-acetyltransferase [Candidatus Kapabacteria bacterium]|nr:GNAT family N-acetyltransferase [Candidatus Kapabacteria bacterium]
MIEYRTSLEGITPDLLEGFFAGWPTPPSVEVHLQLLRHSAHVVLAVEGVRVVGFVNALSDGVMAAYIPLLEVLAEYRGQGIGTGLMHRMLELLQGMYMIDVVCDEAVVPFYRRFGMLRLNAMVLRNHAHPAAAG